MSIKIIYTLDCLCVRIYIDKTEEQIFTYTQENYTDPL